MRESSLMFLLHTTDPVKAYECDKNDYGYAYDGGAMDGEEGCMSPSPTRGKDMMKMICNFAGFPMPAGLAAGGARKSRKASRKNRKASRKNRKASRKNRKASRKNRKVSRKNRKASRKNRKASRKNRK